MHDFVKQKEKFLKILMKKNEDYYRERIKLGDFNYGKRLPGTEKAVLRQIT